MPEPRQARVERLFAEALERPPGERAAFLDSACAGDPGLRAELASLLEAHDEAGSFLDALDGERAASLLASGDAAEGTTIGPYRVVHELGRGGMGVVYLAERADGQFEQRVALKLVKRGMDSDEILRRFLMERQILAQLEHPNIARLLDGGVSAAGQPYFALEHVEGTPLTEYCDERRASVDERLRLFREVCGAVRHAHQKLVIHRDLKPSNILVTASGEPKLLDFGIAKLVDTQASPAAATLTLPRARLVTPEYAAPEQLRGEPASTATDIYALGVILYQLLTGRRPYHFEDRTPLAMERVVAEADADRPSTVVTRPGEDASVEETSPEARARARGMTVAWLQRRLRGDLDMIVLAALRKEPERRYPSVEALAEDVDRHLGGLPVRARPDTLGYRTTKFVRRHRVAVGAAALVAASLVAGLSAALWQARVARREAAKAGAVRDFIVGMFRESDPVATRGEEISARELLDRGAGRIDKDLSEQPELRSELLAVMGELYSSLGLYDRAIELHEKALALRRTLHGKFDLDVADTLAALSAVYQEKGDYERAEPLIREALEIRRRLAGNDHELLGSTLNDLGLVLTEKGDYDAGEMMYRESLAERRLAHRGDHQALAQVLGNLGQVLKYKGEFDEAEKLYRESLAMSRRLHGEDHPQVATIVGNLGVLLAQRGDLEGGAKATQEALEIRQRLYGDEHPDVALTLNNLGMMRFSMAQYDEAEPLIRRALELNRKTFGEENRRVATNMNNLAVVLKAQGNYDAALALYRDALALQRRVLGEDHPYVALIEVGYADALLSTGDLDRAEELIDAAVATQERHLEETHPRVSYALTVLGRLHLERGRIEEAERTLRRAVALGEEAMEEDNWKLAEARALLGECLARQGRFEEAEGLLVDAHRLLEEKRGPGVAATRRARRALFDLYTAWHRPGDAARFGAKEVVASGAR